MATTPIAKLAARLSSYDLRWLLGAAGAGKSTVTRVLARRYGLELVDLDADIYGEWHSRFTSDRHPTNYEWTNVPDSLDWLLAMEPDAAWARFLDFDDHIAQTVTKEATAVGLSLVECKPGDTVTTTVAAVARAFGLRAASTSP